MLFAIDPPTMDAYLRQVQIGEGNASRGEMLFASSKCNCAQCHTVDGKGNKIGPDLLGIAQKLDSSGLAVAVLDPSRDIKPGYEALKLVTQSGELHTGIVQRATDERIEMKLSDGKSLSIQRDEIERQSVSSISLMPAELEKAIDAKEFSDLIAYLRSLELPLEQTENNILNPIQIPTASRLVTFVPLLPVQNELRRPVALMPWPGEPNVLCVVEVEPARIWRMVRESKSNSYRMDLFADLSSETRAGYLEGLFCVAFHPDFVNNGRYFIKMHQGQRGNDLVMQIQERMADQDRKKDSGLAAKTVLSLPMPHINHNGGCLLFGPDGNLYIGFGDGGPQEDPNGYAQSLESWLGKILRININGGSPSDATFRYSVPEDNPFLKTARARPEIWALGFREPWRMSFDSKTGELWVGDVGQNRIEEVAIVRSGENHGWNVLEGFERFSDRFRNPLANYVPPVFSYSHRHGVSVTGGFVYRGSATTPMQGQYIFGDFETRKVWALEQADRSAKQIVEIGQSPSRIASFGEDAAGELYVVGHDPANLYRLDFKDVDLKPAMAAAVLTTAETEPVLWRYTQRSPEEHWSDFGFDDTAWQLAPAGFGSPGTPGAVVRTNWTSSDIWCRRDFQLNSKQDQFVKSRWQLRIHHDEDATVFINGLEAIHLPRWTTGYVDIPLSPRVVESLREGRNTIAIHCHQQSGGQYLDAGLFEIKPTRP